MGGEITVSGDIMAAAAVGDRAHFLSPIIIGVYVLRGLFMGRLEGKVAVLTGANSGIGLATAKRFAREGARLFITGRRQPELDAAVGQVGGKTTGVRGDVSNLADLDRLYEVVRQEAGTIDVLFANAGGGEFAPIQQVTEGHYDRTFDTNVKGTLFTVQKALPLMRDGGSIILTGSTAATTGIPAFSVYSASKAAIRGFARGWVLDLAPRHIRVNVLVPGATSTPGWHGLASSEEQDREMQRLSAAATPLGRLGDPDEIASAALFLASDESSFVNGSELFVDGGSAQI
jgi:NAD(P)-dependent dehydrogenase (short-subunit alcohol dehydrogenase family)